MGSGVRVRIRGGFEVELGGKYKCVPVGNDLVISLEFERRSEIITDEENKNAVSTPVAIKNVTTIFRSIISHLIEREITPEKELSGTDRLPGLTQISSMHPFPDEEFLPPTHP